MGERFEGQVAIVTGAARGIGLGIARRLAAEGAAVVVWDINLKPLDLVSDFRPALTTQVDVTDPESVTSAMQEVIDRFGRLDVLVNNAGITGPVKNADDYDLMDWKRVIDVDLASVFLCCRAVIPHMRTRGYGRIVNVASIAGKEGVPGLSAYSAAKAGVIGFTKSIARELAETGILANSVAPAMVETELLQQMTPELIEASRKKIPMNRFLQVDELVAVVTFAASPECSFTTGFTFDATGGRATY